MKYMLVEVVEREIRTPIIANSYEEVHYEMRRRFAEACGVSVGKVDSFLKDDTEKEFEYDANIGCASAWTEHHGENYDWKIFEVHDDGIRAYLGRE